MNEAQRKFISRDTTRLKKGKKLDTVMDLVEEPQSPLELLISAPPVMVPFESRQGIFVRDLIWALAQ